MAAEILKLEGVNAFYADAHVLHSVCLTLKEGQLLALLGRNGAGKTTCVSAAMGLLRGTSGSIAVDGKPILGKSPEYICRLGLGLVPQGRRIFPSLTVRETLQVAYRRPTSAVGREWNEESVTELFPRLRERRNQLAGSMSGGEQQMLAIGRALMSNPKVILLDEPSEGLAPQIVKEVQSIIMKLRDMKMSILLIEQNTALASSIADEIVILNAGRVTFSGAPSELQERGEFVNTQLGVF